MYNYLIAKIIQINFIWNFILDIDSEIEIIIFPRTIIPLLFMEKFIELYESFSSLCCWNFLLITSFNPLSEPKSADPKGFGLAWPLYIIGKE